MQGHLWLQRVGGQQWCEGGVGGAAEGLQRERLLEDVRDCGTAQKQKVELPDLRRKLSRSATTQAAGLDAQPITARLHA